MHFKSTKGKNITSRANKKENTFKAYGICEETFNQSADAGDRMEKKLKIARIANKRTNKIRKAYYTK